MIDGPKLPLLPYRALDGDTKKLMDVLINMVAKPYGKRLGMSKKQARRAVIGLLDAGLMRFVDDGNENIHAEFWNIDEWTRINAPRIDA